MGGTGKKVKGVGGTGNHNDNGSVLFINSSALNHKKLKQQMNKRDSLCFEHCGSHWTVCYIPSFTLLSVCSLGASCWLVTGQLTTDPSA